MKTYDAIIIGAGQAGVPLARRLAKAGRKVAVIERKWVGGTCVNVGCTPTKAMVASAKMMYDATRAVELGVKADNVSIDMAAVYSRKQKIVLDARSGNEKSLKEIPGIELIYGEASFTAPKNISVMLKDGGKEEMTAEHIFINTGGRTTIPKIEGLDTVQYLTSSTMLELQEVPKKLLIVGGGYISMEFGQMFRRFGSEVVMLEFSEQFLGKEDDDIAAELLKILHEDGIEMHARAEVKKVTKTDNGIEATVLINKEEKKFGCTHILLAAGRTPNTDKLGLDKAGIATDEKGYIKVNDKLETNVQGVYALGDVKGGPAFTHISYNDYLIVCKKHTRQCEYDHCRQAAALLYVYRS